MIWVLFFFLGGGDATSEDEPAACEGLDEQACDDAEHCFATDGWPIHGDYDCENVGPRAYAGCYTHSLGGELDCSDVVVYYHPPGAPDECWEFGDACTPDGWTECGPCWQE